MAWQETGSRLYAPRIAETCDWVLREMAAPEGRRLRGDLDADSEGVEGKFYVWDEAEIDAILGADAAFFKQAYDVTPQGNWEHHTILHRNRRPQLLDDAGEQRLAGLRARLKAVRDKRPWPGWDDKVLADWNGLMIAALANAAAVFRRDDWLAAAVRAWRFVMDRMRDGDGRLFHSHRAAKRLHRGTLDDYANMARAGIALCEATGEMRYLDDAKALIGVLDRHFADPEGRRLLHHRRRCRRPDRAQQALPRQRRARRQRHPGRRLRAAVGADRRGDLHDKARRQVAAFAGELEGNFIPLMTLLNGYELLQSATELVIVGELDDPATEALRRAVYDRSLPNKIVRRLAPDTPSSTPSGSRQRSGRRQTRALCVQRHDLPRADRRSGRGRISLAAARRGSSSPCRVFRQQGGKHTMGERKLAATGRRSAIVALALASTACATIVNGTSQDLYVETQPEAAACKIDRQGATVGMVNPTPSKTSIPRHKDNIVVSCTRDGYETSNEVLAANFSGATFGNLLLGGFVGVVIDASSGANNKYPEKITVILTPATFPSEAARDLYFDGVKSRLSATTEAEVSGSTEPAARMRAIFAEPKPSRS